MLLYFNEKKYINTWGCLISSNDVNFNKVAVTDNVEGVYEEKCLFNILSQLA